MACHVREGAELPVAFLPGWAVSAEAEQVPLDFCWHVPRALLLLPGSIAGVASVVTGLLMGGEGSGSQLARPAAAP